MKQTFDLDEIMFKLLNVKTITDEISGGIYLGDGRPEDSSKEDVVVNSRLPSASRNNECEHLCPRQAISN